MYMMRQVCASKVCPLGILMSNGGLSEFLSPNRRGDKSVDVQPI